jgi:hypothetical protein
MVWYLLPSPSTSLFLSFFFPPVFLFLFFELKCSNSAHSFLKRRLQLLEAETCFTVHYIFFLARLKNISLCSCEKDQVKKFDVLGSEH